MPYGVQIVNSLHKDDKFEERDLPEIHAALERARRSNMYSTVEICFSKEGGMVSLKERHEQKLR